MPNFFSAWPFLAVRILFDRNSWITSKMQHPENQNKSTQLFKIHLTAHMKQHSPFHKQMVFQTSSVPNYPGVRQTVEFWHFHDVIIHRAQLTVVKIFSDLPSKIASFTETRALSTNCCHLVTEVYYWQWWEVLYMIRNQPTLTKNFWIFVSNVGKSGTSGQIR